MEIKDFSSSNSLLRAIMDEIFLIPIGFKVRLKVARSHIMTEKRAASSKVLSFMIVLKFVSTHFQIRVCLGLLMDRLWGGGVLKTEQELNTHLFKGVRKNNSNN